MAAWRRVGMAAWLHVGMAAWGDALDDRLFGDDPELDAKAEEGLETARAYREADQYPFRDGHRTVYLFGAGEATLVCAPLNVCLIELEPTERVVADGVHLGDSVRWLASPTVGAGERTHVALKPVDAGLETTMAIITDRRTYHLRLVSTREEYMAAVAWHYPADAARAWARYHAAAAAEEERETLPVEGIRLSDLDFEYEVSPCRRCDWRPHRVYNDGRRTVIEFPDAALLEEAPVLLVTDGGAEQVANYRIDGRRYLVDGVFGSAMLVAGVGRTQSRVSIRRRAKGE